jgi:hypothetical protein
VREDADPADAGDQGQGVHGVEGVLRHERDAVVADEPVEGRCVPVRIGRRRILSTALTCPFASETAHELPIAVVATTSAAVMRGLAFEHDTSPAGLRFGRACPGHVGGRREPTGCGSADSGSGGS